MKPAIERIELSTQELERLLERARVDPLPEEDYRKLKAAVDTLEYLTELVADKDTTIRHLRQLLLPASTEKTRDVLAKAGAAAANPAADSKPESGQEQTKDRGICFRKSSYEVAYTVQDLSSANCDCFRRCSIVRVEIPNQAAISSSAHCNAQSFSNSTRSIWAGLRPAPGRWPPDMMHSLTEQESLATQGTIRVGRGAPGWYIYKASEKGSIRRTDQINSCSFCSLWQEPEGGESPFATGCWRCHAEVFDRGPVCCSHRTSVLVFLSAMPAVCRFAHSFLNRLPDIGPRGY